MARPKRKKWLGGYVHPESGRYYIEQTYQGRKYHISTGAKTADAALSELSRFEQDREGYLARIRSQPERFDLGSLGQEFLRYSVGSKGNTTKHAEQQGSGLDNFAAFLAVRGLVFAPQIITPAVVDDYVSWRRDGGSTGRRVGPHTVAIDVATLKTFAKWLCKRKMVLETNPLWDYPIPRRPKRSSKIRLFTVEEWGRVRAQLGSLRWRLTGDALLGSWMRYSSLARLRPADVDVGEGVIRLSGNEIKGRKGVTLKVSERIAKAAKALAMGGLPPSASDFDKKLKSACVRAGLESWSAHAFRHSAARMGLDDGMTLQEIQHRLGHSSLQVTEIYLARLVGSRSEYRGRI